MKKKRLTLNKKIAQAPTFAQKWEMALTGGHPMTKIEWLVHSAAALRHESLHGKEWQDDALNRLKQQFADAFFPELMSHNPETFKELLKAFSDFKRYGHGFRPKLPAKVEAGRKLRLALQNLSVEDRVSISTVLDSLSRLGIEYSDESHVRRVMKEIPVRLLIDGQKCQWTLEKNRGLLREVSFENGKLITRGLPEDQLPSEKYYRELMPKDKADK